MSPALRRLLASLAVLAVVVGAVWLLGGLRSGEAGGAPGGVTADAGRSPSSAAAPSAVPTSRATAGRPNPSGLGEVRASALPKEARDTLALIARGGPYPYERDGVVFGNFERILPQKQRGYYHEYTVKTPGESDRGARRIVAGDAGEKYYTDDHYESFRFILEGQ